MTDGKNNRPFPAAVTETFTDRVAQLRADLAALKSEQSLPVSEQRRTLVNRWVELIELELKRLDENSE